jgi:hypothetical protein
MEIWTSTNMTKKRDILKKCPELGIISRKSGQIKALA